jgi:hypothetical protein
MNKITKPTTLTELQYEKAVFAIDRENADHYLMYGNIGKEHVLENSLWVCRDEESMNNTNPQDMPSFEINGVDVIGEDGVQKEIEAITFSTKESLNKLDLHSLSEGRIDWI